MNQLINIRRQQVQFGVASLVLILTLLGVFAALWFLKFHTFQGSLTWYIGHLLAVGIGISLGLVGGGGSVLAAPILIYVMGVPAKSAFAMTLVIVGVVSLIGIIPHWKQGNVNVKTAAFFSPTAMLGAYLGACIASLPTISPTIQLIAFASMMLVASMAMIFKRTDQSDELPEGVDNEQHSHQYQGITIAAEGLGVGMLTGFVGIGGGFMVIPALVLLGQTPIKEAVGTSLIILTLKSVTGFAGYLGHVSVDWLLMISFTVAASIGILVGAYLTKYIQAKHLEKGFGYFIFAVALFILIKR